MTRSIEPVGTHDHVRGAAGDRAITVVVYGDYDCPHTRASQAVVDRLLAENQDVRVVFRHFPLRHIHANAEILSRIAEASAAQGKFWEMHDHLMHHRSAIGQDDVLADARTVGVDLEAVIAALDSGALAARVERDVQSGRASGVHSTPSFFFDGVLHDGHYDHATLAKRLAEARARKTT